MDVDNLSPPNRDFVHFGFQCHYFRAREEHV